MHDDEQVSLSNYCHTQNMVCLERRNRETFLKCGTCQIIAVVYLILCCLKLSWIRVSYSLMTTCIFFTDSISCLMFSFSAVRFQHEVIDLFIKVTRRNGVDGSIQ